jgi:hypothetical protein
MKRTSLTLLLALFIVSAFAQREGVDRNGNVKVEDLYNELMEIGSGGVFRGASFDMTKAQVLKLETDRATTSVYRDETPEELVITTDMGSDILNFGDITYTFDEKGLYHIKVETFATTNEANKKVYEKIVAFYTSKFGQGVVAEDGYLEFTAKGKSQPYVIALDALDSETSPGIYMFIYMK